MGLTTVAQTTVIRARVGVWVYVSVGKCGRVGVSVCECMLVGVSGCDCG